MHAHWHHLPKTIAIPKQRPSLTPGSSRYSVEIVAFSGGLLIHSWNPRLFNWHCSPSQRMSHEIFSHPRSQIAPSPSLLDVTYTLCCTRQTQLMHRCLTEHIYFYYAEVAKFCMHNTSPKCILLLAWLQWSVESASKSIHPLSEASSDFTSHLRAQKAVGSMFYSKKSGNKPRIDRRNSSDI